MINTNSYQKRREKCQLLRYRFQCGESPYCSMHYCIVGPNRTQQALKHDSESSQVIFFWNSFQITFDVDSFSSLVRLSCRATVSATSCWQDIKPQFNKVRSILASTGLMVPNVVFTQNRWGSWEQSQTYWEEGRLCGDRGPGCHDWALRGHRKHGVKSFVSLVMIVWGEFWCVPAIVTGSLVQGALTCFSEEVGGSGQRLKRDQHVTSSLLLLWHLHLRDPSHQT